MAGGGYTLTSIMLLFLWLQGVFMMEYKEHTKLYKSGKLWVAATIATTAVATGLVNTQTTAHADTTDQTQAVEGMSAD